MPKPKFLIARSGIGRLAAVRCLLQTDHDVEVLKQACERTEIAASIRCNANAVPLLRHLEIADSVDELSNIFAKLNLGKERNHRLNSYSTPKVDLI